MKLKRVLALVLTLSMVFSMTAMTGFAEEETSLIDSIEKAMEVEVDPDRKSTANSDERYDKIVVPNDDMNDLTPFNNTGGSKNCITIELYESLFDLTADNELVGRIAKDYTEIDDTHVQVEIYDYVYDSEGNHITASDVVFSYNENVASGYAQDMGSFESAEAIDDYTVEFTWNAPLSSLTAFNSMMNYVCIFSEEAYNNHEFATDPIGTGPYVLDSFAVGSSVVLEARDDYWQTDELRNDLAQANVQTLEFDVLADTSMQVIALQDGSIDYCEVTAQNLADYMAMDNLNLYYLPNSFNISLLCNCSEDSPLNDKNLRLAVYYCIDNNAIATALGADTYYATAYNASKVCVDYNPEWEEKETYNTVYDPDLAKEYLAESSYNGETLSILSPSLEANQNAATVVMGFLTAIGINAELNINEPPAVNGVAANSTDWDLWVQSGSSASGYVISRIVSDFDPDYVAYGVSKEFLEDDYLLEQIRLCNSPNGYSPELTDEIIQYMQDNAYDYGIYSNNRVYAFYPMFASFATWYNSSAFVFGACNYYLD